LFIVFCLIANATEPVQLAKLTQAELATQNRNAAWAQPLDESWNLFEVTPSLYRSEKIEPKFLPQLQQLGITTVISFRKFHRYDEIFKKAGIKMVRVPMLTWRLRDAEIKKALNHINQANGKVLIHCQHGADRTGLVAAMYRIVEQGWSKQDALDELKNGGYGYHSMWKNIIEYIEKVDVEKFKSP
jgi:protein tyrosine/serine phosphatase